MNEEFRNPYQETVSMEIEMERNANNKKQRGGEEIMKKLLIREDVKAEKILIFARFCPNCRKVIAAANPIFLEGTQNENIIGKVSSLDSCVFCKHELTSEELTDKNAWKTVEVVGLVCPVCDNVTPRTNSYARKRYTNVFPCIQCGALLFGGESSSCGWDIKEKRYGCIECKLLHESLS